MSIDEKPEEKKQPETVSEEAGSKNDGPMKRSFLSSLFLSLRLKKEEEEEEEEKLSGISQTRPGWILGDKIRTRPGAVRGMDRPRDRSPNKRSPISKNK